MLLFWPNLFPAHQCEGHGAPCQAFQLLESNRPCHMADIQTLCSCHCTLLRSPLERSAAAIMTRRHRTLENTEGRSRDMMQTRTHPLLASHNPWTWKFLPGVALGFLAHWWLSKNKEQKVAQKCSCFLQDSSTARSIELCRTFARMSQRLLKDLQPRKGSRLFSPQKKS